MEYIFGNQLCPEKSVMCIPERANQMFSFGKNYKKILSSNENPSTFDDFDDPIIYETLTLSTTL